ncbi:MAG: hypothetical protein NTU80_06680 [Verrucomicrobia bacterium]|nr:hypothetical protein [Verrucomicrobiota bacterium]
MTVVIAKPSEKQVKQEIRAMKKAGERINATPATAKAFLLKHGFMTKDGKLHPRYR